MKNKISKSTKIPKTPEICEIKRGTTALDWSGINYWNVSEKSSFVDWL